MTKIVTLRPMAAVGFPPKNTPNALIHKGFLVQAEKLAWGVHVRRHPSTVLGDERDNMTSKGNIHFPALVAILDLRA